MAYYFYLVHHLGVLWHAKFQCALCKHNMLSFVPCQRLPKYLSTTFSASEWKEQSEVYILRLNHVSHNISIYASCKYEGLLKEKRHASFNWHHYIWRAVVVHDMGFIFLTRHSQFSNGGVGIFFLGSIKSQIYPCMILVSPCCTSYRDLVDNFWYVMQRNDLTLSIMV